MKPQLKDKPHAHRCLSVAVFLIAFVLVAGCRSRFVEATIDNRSSHALQLVEVDYPSASFGIGAIPAHSQYHYRFKVLGSGSVKLSFTDAAGKPHTSSGPELDEGQEGSIQIAIDDATDVSWATSLKSLQ